MNNCKIKILADAVKIAAMKRGMTLAKLAQQCGVTVHSFYTLLGNGELGVRFKARVEQVFDFEEPIWSSSRDLQLRKSCFERTGKDPAVMRKKELKDLAKRIGARLTGVPAMTAKFSWILVFRAGF